MAKSKPKPRLAVYGGMSIGALALGKRDGSRGFDVVFGSNRKSAAQNLAADAVTAPAETIAKGGIIAGAGVLLSVAADKIGVNRMLAKARMPFRV